SAVSARTLLAKTEPIFSVRPRAVATFGPSGPLTGSQYMALALQNPNMADVKVRLSAYAANGTFVLRAVRTLASRHRLALTVSEPGGRRRAAAERVIEKRHELGARPIRHVPHRRHGCGGAGGKQRAAEPFDAFAAHDLAALGFAGRQRDERDVAQIEVVDFAEEE